MLQVRLLLRLLYPEESVLSWIFEISVREIFVGLVYVWWRRLSMLKLNLAGNHSRILATLWLIHRCFDLFFSIKGSSDLAAI